MDERVLKLESELKELKEKLNNKKERKPRELSEYNKFISGKIKEIKDLSQS